MGSKRALNLLRRLGGEFRVENASLRLDQQIVKVTATTTLLAKDSGKLHIVGPLAAGLQLIPLLPYRPLKMVSYTSFTLLEAQLTHKTS